MKNKEINSGLTGKKNSQSMISSALEDFFKPSAGNVDSENVLSDRFIAWEALLFLVRSFW